MLEIKVSISPNVWLQLPADTRQYLAKEFGIQSSESPRCVTENGHTRVESDGRTVRDLMAMSVESMQKWLGFAEVNPDEDVHALFRMCADRAEKALRPTPDVERERDVERPVEVPASEPEQSKPQLKKLKK